MADSKWKRLNHNWLRSLVDNAFVLWFWVFSSLGFSYWWAMCTAIKAFASNLNYKERHLITYSLPIFSYWPTFSMEQIGFQKWTPIKLLAIYFMWTQNLFYNQLEEIPFGQNRHVAIFSYRIAFLFVGIFKNMAWVSLALKCNLHNSFRHFIIICKKLSRAK